MRKYARRYRAEENGQRETEDRKKAQRGSRDESEKRGNATRHESDTD
jgi:hypothetical protein